MRKVRNNPQYLQVALANIDWTKLAAMQDVDEMVNFFIKEIKKVLDRVAPFKNLKNRSKNKFKLSNDTLTEIKKRDKLKELLNMASTKLINWVKPFSCGSCDKTFSDGKSLNEHERVHNIEEPFSCSSCDRTFPDRKSLNEHERVHNIEEPFSCAMCDETFSDRKSLNEHERVHDIEEPFSCASCDQKFSDLNSLNQHERVHNEKLPFSCAMCDMSFSEERDLSNHEKTLQKTDHSTALMVTTYY